MINRFAPAFGLAALALALAPQAARAQAFAAPAGYAAQDVFGTNAGIAGFDVAGDGSIVMILGSGGFGSSASSLVRWDPVGNSFTTLHTFSDSPFGNFVEVIGSTAYFGQSGVFGDSASETNRIMSIGLDGSGFTTNLILQNYTAAQDPEGRLFFSGSPDSNGVFVVSGPATNRVADMPTYSAGLTFTTNGDLYAGQFSAGFQNNLFRFTEAQVSNAIALGIALQPSDGIQVGTNLAGSSYLAADSDTDIFFPDFSGTLYAFDIVAGTASAFGSVTGGFAAVGILQFDAGPGDFEAFNAGSGTLYALLTDYGSFNQIVAITAIPEPGTLATVAATMLGLAIARRRRGSI